MLTQTSETAIQALIYLAVKNSPEPMPPREIADGIEASPTYMAKITRMLVKANILKSHRGALGGVTLSREPSSVTLLEIVEACQGLLIGNYCDGIDDHQAPLCQFHQAMFEVHQTTVSVLRKWTLRDLATCPYGKDVSESAPCKMRSALQYAKA